jgi:hypothetical protein
MHSDSFFAKLSPKSSEIREEKFLKALGFQICRDGEKLVIKPDEEM